MSLDTSAFDQAPSADELLPGTLLFKGQYTIKKVLNSGGFGITYLATDLSNREVVIKECFSGSHCRRMNSRVRPRSSGSRPEMTRLLKYFLKEARSLSSLTHPNVVHVHQVFQENDTAYMVLDHIIGDDLQHLVQAGKQARSNASVMELAFKLVSVLDYVHKNDLLHRDIAPDNVFINADDEPILIDFGAASWISDDPGNDALGLVVVKDGYSPHEFYHPDGNLGPWSDIYSLAATLSFTITGVAPVTSQKRLAARAERIEDPQPKLAGTISGYPDGFLESIDKALSVLPNHRYQSTDDWLADLKLLKEYEDQSVRLLDKALGLRRSQRPAKGAQPPVLSNEPPKAETPRIKKGYDMSLDITGLNEIAGFIGGCLVDSETGMMLAAVGGGKLDLEAASAANTEVVRAKNQAISILGLNDSIEDILITLGKQFHLIRPMEKAPSVFLYIALDRKTANLGLARVQLKKVEQTLSI